MATDNTNREVLDYLRAQFDRLHVKLDRVIDDVSNLKVRVNQSRRLDQIDGRLDRIERRLDLVDAPVGEA